MSRGGQDKRSGRFLQDRLARVRRDEPDGSRRGSQPKRIWMSVEGGRRYLQPRRHDEPVFLQVRTSILTHGTYDPSAGRTLRTVPISTWPSSSSSSPRPPTDRSS